MDSRRHQADGSSEADDARVALDKPWAEIEAYSVAAEFIELLARNNGWVGEGGLEPYRKCYRQFDDDGARIFRATLTSYLAKLFARLNGRRAFPLAAAVVDAWFPPRPAARPEELPGEAG